VEAKQAYFLENTVASNQIKGLWYANGPERTLALGTPSGVLASVTHFPSRNY
jgi:hypothetical protein